MLEFDAEGNLQTWGGPEDPGKCKPPACVWPESEHGIFVDDDDHVWVSGNGLHDRMLLEFTRDCKFLIMMIGASFSGPPDWRAAVGTPGLEKRTGLGVEFHDTGIEVAVGDVNLFASEFHDFRRPGRRNLRG